MFRRSTGITACAVLHCLKLVKIIVLLRLYGRTVMMLQESVDSARLALKLGSMAACFETFKYF